jgi:hypothetical protein
VANRARATDVEIVVFVAVVWPGAGSLGPMLRQAPPVLASVWVLYAIAGCGTTDQKLCEKLRIERSDANRNKTVLCAAAHVDPSKPESARTPSERLAVQRADEPCKLAMGGNGVCSADDCIYEAKADDTAWVKACADELSNLGKTQPIFAQCVRRCIDLSDMLLRFGTCAAQCG